MATAHCWASLSLPSDEQSGLQTNWRDNLRLLAVNDAFTNVLNLELHTLSQADIVQLVPEVGEYQWETKTALEFAKLAGKADQRLSLHCECKIKKWICALTIDQTACRPVGAIATKSHWEAPVSLY